jgi:guanylate kinase
MSWLVLTLLSHIFSSENLYNLAGIYSSLSCCSMKLARDVIILCGPSGCGKSTLITKLNESFPGKFGFSVSHTTRSPRPGEEDGVHYHFRTRPEVELMSERGEFLENAEVHGNLYGTSFAAVEAVKKRRQVCILDIDVQGVDKVKTSGRLNCMYVFVKPPSVEVLEQRLRGRGTETEEKIQLRLANAVKELKYSERADGFWDAVLINDELDRCYSQLNLLVKSQFGDIISN